MKKPRNANDTSQAAYLERSVRRFVEDPADVEGSALDWSLGYVVSGHLKYDFEWADRFIDIVGILSVEVSANAIWGLGALYWAPDPSLGSGERPEPLSFDIRYDPEAAEPVTWYEVTFWSETARFFMDPDGARRVTYATDPGARPPSAPFLAVVADVGADSENRLAAAHLVSSRCDGGPDAVVDLMERLDENDAEGRQACVTGLQRASWEADVMPDAVVRALDSSDPAVRASAAVTLWTADDDPIRAPIRDRALPELLSAIGVGRSIEFTTVRGVIVGSKRGIGRLARSVLAEAAKERDDVLDLLIAALADPASEASAIKTLEQVGPAARRAIDPLCDLYKDTEHKREVWEALCAISEENALKVAAMLSSDDPKDREFAARVLASAEPHTVRWVAGVLIAALETGPLEARDRFKIARSLARAEPREEEVRAALRRLVPELAAPFADFTVSEVSSWETDVLKLIGPDAADAVPILVDRARRHGSVGAAALEVLGAIGPAAVEAAPSLAEILEFDDGDEDRYANKVIEALGAMGPEAARELVPILDWETSENGHLSYIAYSAGKEIQAIGEAASPVVSEIFRRDPESVAAVRALRWVGPSAVPTLLEALASPSASIRIEAARALGKIGPEASGAVSALAPLLRDTSEDLASVAARTLGRIGPDAAPALRAALEDAFAPEPYAWVLRLLREMGE